MITTVMICDRFGGLTMLADGSLVSSEILSMWAGASCRRQCGSRAIGVVAATAVAVANVPSHSLVDPLPRLTLALVAPVLYT